MSKNTIIIGMISNAIYVNLEYLRVLKDIKKSRLIEGIIDIIKAD